MNEQQGKHLDQRIRQALDKLPDAPAPGSTFDAGKLWEQLRPELAAETAVLAPKRMVQVQPVLRKRGWLVAASLAGLLIVWLWWSWQPVTKPSLASQQGVDTTAGKNVRAERVTRPYTEISAVAAPPRAALKAKTTGKLAAHEAKLPENTLLASTKASKPVAQPEVVANVPDQPATASRPVMAEAISQSSVVAVQSPKMKGQKRRFQVVHVNELKTEEEAVYSQIQARKSSNERFVRIGTGQQSSISSDEPSPTIQLPLNRKSPQ